MLHACFTPIALSFTTILWHFYTISDTNLLTRYRSASSLLSVVFGFRKVTKEIFSELDETKAETPIFPEHSRTPKERCSWLPGRTKGVWATPWPPDSVLSPIYCLPSETHEKFRRRHHRQP